MHPCLFLSLLCLNYASAVRVNKRRPSEDRVTIDLSALRPSLPGLVLYEYGDLAPKLVQVDLSSLNPLIQPHVIWPQFDQMDLDRPFELEGAMSDDAIPYLTMDDVSPRRMSRLEDWRDMYDFVQDGSSHDPMLSLQGSLPLADEVIVPLDWEEDKNKKKKQKKNVFLTRGWRAGGERGGSGATQKQRAAFPKMPKGMMSNFNSYNSRNGLSRPSPRRRETETEDGRKAARRDGRSADQEPVRPVLSSQESWSVPRQYWNVPHLFVNNWQ